MKKLSRKEAAKVLEDMKVKIEIPKAAVTQWIRNTALDMAIEALKYSEIPNSSDSISRQAAIEAVHNYWIAESHKLPRKMVGEYEVLDGDYKTPLRHNKKICEAIEALPSAQPPKEIPKRVLWSGWKGYRDTRYKCPNCEKPVRKDDAYCHRCGQRLMFPKISFTAYVPGEKQDVIVRWDDEG